MIKCGNLCFLFKVLPKIQERLGILLDIIIFSKVYDCYFQNKLTYEINAHSNMVFLFVRKCNCFILFAFIHEMFDSAVVHHYRKVSERYLLVVTGL